VQDSKAGCVGTCEADGRCIGLSSQAGDISLLSAISPQTNPIWKTAMKRARRDFLQIAAGAAALPAVSRIDGARAEAYPTRPITMIVPSPAGGTGDAIARVIADRMRRSLVKPIVIENVAGADGGIGSGRVARARPDGYTIEHSSMSTHVLNGVFYPLPYDVLNGFAPIALTTAGSPMIVGRKTFPANDVRELIIWLKANPNKASMAVASTAARLLATFLQQQTETQFALVRQRLHRDHRPQADNERQLCFARGFATSRAVSMKI
jgi:tripartite-type tricarboxylate transporter receptor subunit TctC